MKRLLLPLTLATLAAPTFAFAGARAQLAGSLAAGQATQLDVTVDGDATRPPEINVPGARVHLNGQMSSTQIVNGAASQQTRFVYSLVPDATGPLDIPAISVATPNGTQQTAPIHANVSASPGPSAFSGSAASAANTSTAGAAAAASPGSAPVIQSSSHAFITLDVPTHKLVVGQAIPVTIRAYFRAGTSATLDGAPHLTTDAFTLSNLSDKPAQTQVQLRGEPYLQATWTALLSPAKPSSGKLAVELPVELAYRAAPRQHQHRTLRDVFGSDPFADAFGDSDPFAGMGADMDMDIDSMFDIGPMQQEQVTLRGPTSTVTVVEPPADGKPADYAGAVGAFALSVDPPAGTPRVGEPLTLAFHVTGNGNFDRVTGVAIGDAPGIKTYPAKSDFVAGTSPLTGTKTFTQTVVPTTAGALTLPTAAFSYFDPAKHAYVTAHTTPLSVTVEAAPGGGAADPGLAASVREPGMLPNRVDPGEAQADLVPLVDRASTWIGVAAILALAVLATLIAWSRRSHRIASVLASRRVDREVARATEEMQRAADAEDPTAFFTAARHALQTRLASSWHTRADAITAHDVAARLGPRGETIREVFEHADGLAYGAPTNEPLEYWDDVVRAELAHLEVSP